MTTRQKATTPASAVEPEDALSRQSAIALARMLRSSDVSAVEVATAVVNRVRAREDAVHAWAHFDTDFVLESAERIDRAGPRPEGLLYGVPVAVKDLIDTADAPTAYGTVRHRLHRPAQDAACVRACRDAGALVAGKSVTTELALPVAPVTRNPIRESRSAGGSSAGSAAAVADFMVPLALGTQTAGSVIRPASYCGVLGLVPTRRRWDVSGVLPISPSLDRLGAFAREFEDLRLVTSVLERGRRHPSARPIRSRPRIGLMSDVDEAVPELCMVLRRLGDVRPIGSEPLLERGAQIQSELMDAEMSLALAGEAAALDEYDEPTRSLLAGLRDGVFREPADLHRDADAFRSSVEETISELDVIVSSAVSGEAPPALEGVGDPFYCRAWSLLGLPVVSVPVCVGATGMPVGLQVVGHAHADASVIDVAESLRNLVPASEPLLWVR